MCAILDFFFSTGKTGGSILSEIPLESLVTCQVKTEDMNTNREHGI